MGEELPYLTAGILGVACTLKQRPEDFVVEEQLARAPLGHGGQCWITVEKRGLTTHEAARRLARALGVGPRAVGYAGLKDARAITRQSFSVEGLEPGRALALRLDGLRVLAAERDEGALRPGRGSANRFRVRLRGVEAGADERVREVLALIERRGLPNWFGEQRFGVRGDAWLVGRALARGEAQEALAWIAGRPGRADAGRVRRARQYFDKGQWARAARMYPASLRDHVRICRALHRRDGDFDRALRVLDRGLLKLFVAAWQSRLFNAVLAARLARFDALLAGDLAWRHADGRLLAVEDPVQLAVQAQALELSPTGPLPGRRVRLPSGEPLELEREALAGEGADHRETSGCPYAPPGGRRPLRVPLREVELTEASDAGERSLELAFVLPSGAYATALLREIRKDADPAGADLVA